MNRQYVHATRHDATGRYRPSSFHVVLTPTRVPNTYRTLCGRTLTGDVMDELPAAKSCESCLRIVARQDDVALPETHTDPAGEDDATVAHEAPNL